tara:strand:- start:2629 stop:2883 length:255 start_codon:yes stop_codon:yes gene_type:complete
MFYRMFFIFRASRTIIFSLLNFLMGVFMRYIAKISIILFALAMLPIAEIIWNTNAMNPFYIKEMLVSSLIISSIGFIWVAIYEV